jgi:hypothetical protein
MIGSPDMFTATRHYDPEDKFILSKDPIGYRGGVNLHAYVRANPTNWADPTGLYVGAAGLGGSGAWSGNVAPGLFGSGALLYVNDDKGNWGIAACGGGGLAAGKGVVVGVQTSHLWGVNSICDLESVDPSLSFGAGGGAGPGASVDIGPAGLNVVTGFGLGGYSGALNVVSGCKLLYSKEPCKKNQSCK